MAGLRAPRAGSARDQQIKVEKSFDPEEAIKCLAWIREVTGERIAVEDLDDSRHRVAEFFYKTLKDGFLLTKLVNALVPDDMQINTNTLTYKKSNNDAFEMARERSRFSLAGCIIIAKSIAELEIRCGQLFYGEMVENSSNEQSRLFKKQHEIEMFCQKIQEFGVSEAMSFQTDSLYEKTNLPQVVAAIRNFGIEAESHPSYHGNRFWPKKSEINIRNFSEEQLRASEGVINLQMGSNKGANQSGMTFGKKRMITKD